MGVSAHFFDMGRAEMRLSKNLIRRPHHLAHVLVALGLGACLKIFQRIAAQQVEQDAVGHDIGSGHRRTLALVVKTLVGLKIGTEIFVERNTDERIANDDALVERSNLRVDARNGKVGNRPPKPLKRIFEGMVDVGQVGILNLNFIENALQRGVLIKTEKLAIDVRVAHLAELQNIFDERARLDGILRAHLLQRGIVARRQVTALQSVETLDRHCVVVLVTFSRVEFELARCAENDHRNEI